tara:strand:+ start:3030 stop:3269 length:240 start_codon:yes stop_codon:yes gene_type:complete
MDTVKDLGNDYEIITNRRDIEETLYDVGFNLGSVQYINSVFISFEDPQGGINGYRIFVCEQEFPSIYAPIWEVYPNSEY